MSRLRLLLAIPLLLLLMFALVYAMGRGWLGNVVEVGAPTDTAVPEARVVERSVNVARAAAAIGADDSRRILFGDLHVHSGFSMDAFVASTPLAGGDGAYTVSDACDFARFCSALDFWSINDHAEASSPRRWRETLESIRSCNAIAGRAADPDLVSFLGWEWSQIGSTPDNHWGHKNVVLRDLGDDAIPTRPIAADSPANPFRPLPVLGLGLIPFIEGDAAYLDVAATLYESGSVPRCPDGVPVRSLPDDCREWAATPADLFAKLDDWGYASLVIPHGTTWGNYTPVGSSWRKQLAPGQHDPKRQRLVEIYSGHGNTEEYRDWRGARRSRDGAWMCPEPTAEYLPSCWQAGEAMRARCLAAGESAETCEGRARDARRHFLEAPGVSGHLTLGSFEVDEWLDSGQCRDCFLPAFNFRPGSSVQAMLAYRAVEPPAESEAAARFRFGILGSSDNHTARPGTGYKEYARSEMVDVRLSRVRLPGTRPLPRRDSPVPVEPSGRPPTDWIEQERLASFFYTGGLAAVHAGDRSREAIWQALERREVYATSGPRILLWFDLLNSGGEPGRLAPMGSETRMRANPVFRVRAVGSREQQPGCPDHVEAALPAKRLARLCRGECHHPGDERRAITRIEVVRIRPQVSEGEPLAQIIEDPWLVYECPGDAVGCVFEFEDASFDRAARDTVYYVRAVEEPMPTINADGLRCSRDAQGRCLAIHGCLDVPDSDACLAPAEHRAWSSPIFVDHASADET